MQEVFKIKSSKLTQNFNNISSILKNPKFLKKNPKTWVSKAWMHEMPENISIPYEEKLGEAWRNLVEQIWGR